MADVDYDKLAETLENQELDAPNGVPSDTVYEKLLAIYLLQHDVMSAKLLWKRVPMSVKQQSPHLERVWSVGRLLFQRNRAAVIHALTSTQWRPTVAPIMTALTESYRERTIHLISEAYFSISLDEVGKLLGLSQEQLVQKLNTLGWQIDETNQMVLPKVIPKEKAEHMPSEKQLQRLTQYVSFLEVGL